MQPHFLRFSLFRSKTRSHKKKICDFFFLSRYPKLRILCNCIGGVGGEGHKENSYYIFLFYISFNFSGSIFTPPSLSLYLNACIMYSLHVYSFYFVRVFFVRKYPIMVYGLDGCRLLGE